MPSPVYNNFQNLITFSRASNATLVDATGRITYAPNNLSPYINYTGVGAGFWNINSATVTQNNVTAPDGTLTAARIVTDGTTINQGVYLNNVSVVGRNEIFSVYLRGAVGGEVVQIGDASARTNVTLTTSWVRYNAPAHAMVNANNIIYAQANTAMTFYVWGPQTELVTYQTTPSTYNPTTTAAYYGPRLDYDPATLALKGLLVEEARTNLLTYSEQFDNAAWTTLAQNATVTANAAVAPDGTTTADRFVENTANNFHIIQQNYTTSTSGNYAFSFFAKANSSGRYAYVQLTVRDPSARRYSAVVDLSTGAVLGTATFQSPTGTSILVTAAGNGWYRIVLTSTAVVGLTQISTYIGSANSATFDANTFVQYTGDGTSGLFIWGAQLEAGSFATSYIPTVAASVARSADLASMTGSQFAPWYNRNAGTLVVTGTLFSNGGNAPFTAFSDGTTANGIGLNAVPSNTFTGMSIRANSASQADLFAVSTASAGPIKIAGAWQTDSAAYATAGVIRGTKTSAVVIPTATTLQFPYLLAANGSESRGSSWIQSITYYPRQLSNSQLQSLTS